MVDTTTGDTDQSRAQYVALQKVVRNVTERLQRTWRERLDPKHIGDSFADAVTPAFAETVARGQVQAAGLAEPYLAATIGGPQTGTVAPAAFAGQTAAGAPLEAVANTALRRVLTDLHTGLRPSDALDRGLVRLLTYAHTEINDTGRSAVQTQMIANPGAGGYERVVNLPACDRCLVLAGKLYKHSTGFARHPRCDCGMMPVTSQQWRTENLDNEPNALFRSMSTQQQNQAFGAGNAQAIREGANISQVVNARRGAVRTAGQDWTQTTSSGTSVRGWYGGYTATERATKRPGSRYRRVDARPTASAVIERANREHMGRTELVQTLHHYGYLVRHTAPHGASA